MKENFLRIPNSPEGKVSLAACGNYPKITDALENEGIKTLSFSSEILPREVSRHSDMLLCHTGGKYIFCEPRLNTDILTREGFIVTSSEELGENYPLDVKLNTAVTEDYFICNKKSIDKALFDFFIASGKKPIFTNQGYTKCSVCFVTENAVITEDTSIYEALKDTSFDVLLISKGDIYLSDKHCGFFGGSTGKLNKNTLAVTGELKYHRDRDKILRFCEKHEVEIKELISGRITDIGGILPLKEMR